MKKTALEGKKAVSFFFLNLECFCAEKEVNFPNKQSIYIFV